MIAGKCRCGDKTVRHTLTSVKLLRRHLCLPFCVPPMSRSPPPAMATPPSSGRNTSGVVWLDSAEHSPQPSSTAFRPGWRPRWGIAGACKTPWSSPTVRFHPASILPLQSPSVTRGFQHRNVPPFLEVEPHDFFLDNQHWFLWCKQKPLSFPLCCEATVRDTWFEAMSKIPKQLNRNLVYRKYVPPECLLFVVIWHYLLIICLSQIFSDQIQ